MRRRYHKKSESLAEESFNIVLGLTILAVVYLGFVYYADRAQFWHEIKTYVIPVVILLVCLIAGYLFFVFQVRKRKEVHIENILNLISQKEFNVSINNFVDRFGKEGKGNPWKYRGYSFDWDRMRDFRESAIRNGIEISTKDFRELIAVLEHFIDTKEKNYLNAGIETKASHSLSELNKEGDDFELLVVRLYHAMGFESKRIGGRGDQGGDVLASKDGENVLIQAKFYSGSVGNAAVQQAVGARQYYGCAKAVVITTSYFTPEAIALAKANSVELIDGSLLKQKLLEHLKEMWL